MEKKPSSYVKKVYITNNHYFPGNKSNPYTKKVGYKGTPIYFIILGIFCTLCCMLTFFRMTLGPSSHAVDFQSFLEYIVDNFSKFSTFLSNFQIPLEWHLDTLPMSLQYLARFAQSIVLIFNYFYYIIGLVFKVVYVVISVLVWLITGVAI